ncbi:zinc-ribbon domain-containing protein, partial [Actinosynnema sp. NPDC023658]|uniref:zinc-ribbon domain-containing protein n=1 Tax=Actinosynnema sp. NPDC023658 TaxID=3155465 RepID=UPI00340C1EBF
WRWSADQRHNPWHEIWPLERVTAHLAENGFDIAEPIRGGYDPVVTRCRKCGNLSAQRMGDVTFGCTCRRNTRSNNPAAARPGRVLLTESNSPALPWWDHDRNDDTTLRTITVRAVRRCHWLCPDCGLSFTAKVNDMADRPSCPDCTARDRSQWQQQYERWKVTPVADVPELMAAWADDADPRTVMVGSGTPLRRFRCPHGHHPRISPLRYHESGCPHCQATKADKRWLADTLPEIASQWHPDLNGELTPHNVVWDSKRTVWWRADCCGHQWQETVRDRDKYKRLRCTRCDTILGSLAWHDPGLAAEWSPTNPLTAWQVRPHKTTSFTPEWICSTNPTHVWRAPLSTRSNGAECPECREHGKSRVELDHYDTAKDRFGTARSGAVLRDPAFTSRTSWTVDISVAIQGRTVVIEYDGAYWHAAPPKILIDERKTRDLLAAGYTVVRLREDDLPALDVDHHNYREVRVHSAAPNPGTVMDEIHRWIHRSAPQ